METRGRGRKQPPDDVAITEVLGSVLLVGITVVAAAGLALATTRALQPPEHLFADLVAIGDAIDPVAGTGRIDLRHVGGDDLATDAVHVELLYAGSTERLEGALLLDGFADGTFVLGDAWAREGDYAACEIVRLLVVSALKNGGSQLILGADVLIDDATCGGGP